MQALFTHALRQTQSINSDLGLLEASLDGSSSASPYDGPSSSSNLQGNGIDSAGLNGQIVASLAALQRTVDDYENMAKRELVESNKAKSAAWVLSYSSMVQAECELLATADVPSEYETIIPS